MKKSILAIILFLLGCAAIPIDPHPELSRTFEVGIDIPGEYPH